MYVSKLQNKFEEFGLSDRFLCNNMPSMGAVQKPAGKSRRPCCTTQRGADSSDIESRIVVWTGVAAAAAICAITSHCQLSGEYQATRERPMQIYLNNFGKHF